MDAIVPERTVVWQWVEAQLRTLFSSYCYSEIRLPVVERTELFKRSIGEVTDIVEKEMYTFDDHDESLTLRPEGTAGCVRAAIDKGLLHNQQRRLWYAGPMFRREKPQEGRYRQFHQVGVEAFGFAGVDIEVEQLLFTQRLWNNLGVKNLRLEVNSLGTSEERSEYRQALLTYLEAHNEALDEDSRRRLRTNPLRILDSKNPALQDLIRAAPTLSSYFTDDSRNRFDELKQRLTDASVPFTLNTRLVRGLDYYCHTVYEWVTDELGAQGTVCAGGRYDGLLAQLGGAENFAVGFAIGMDRLVLLLTHQGLSPVIATPLVYFVGVGLAAEREMVLCAERVRNLYPSLGLAMNSGGGSFKNQMKKADRSGALIALLIGDDELASKQYTIKYLREAGKQIKIERDGLHDLISSLLPNKLI